MKHYRHFLYTINLNKKETYKIFLVRHIQQNLHKRRFASLICVCVYFFVCIYVLLKHNDAFEYLRQRVYVCKNLMRLHVYLYKILYDSPLQIFTSPPSRIFMRWLHGASGVSYVISRLVPFPG